MAQALKVPPKLRERREALQRAIVLLDTADDYVAKAYATYGPNDEGWTMVRQVRTEIVVLIGNLEDAIDKQK